MDDTRLAASAATPQPEHPGLAPDLWNPDVAGLWSVLFTPVFGSVLLLRNWQAIEEPDQIRKARSWLGISLLAFLASLFYTPIALVYLFTWYFAWQRPQTRYIRARWGKGYPRRGWILPLFLAVLVMVAVWLALAMVLGMLAASGIVPEPGAPPA